VWEDGDFCLKTIIANPLASSSALCPSKSVLIRVKMDKADRPQQEIRMWYEEQNMLQFIELADLKYKQQHVFLCEDFFKL
jgi:hypothetical protein